MINKNDRFRLSTMLRSLDVNVESKCFDSNGFKGYNFTLYDFCILDDQASDLYFKTLTEDKRCTSFLVSRNLDENRYVDYAHSFMKRGGDLPIFLPLNNKNLSEILNFSISNLEGVKQWRQFILGLEAPNKWSEIFLSQLCNNKAAAELTRISLLRLSDSKEFGQDESTTIKSLENICQRYPSSPLIGAFSAEAYFRAGKHRKAYENSKRIFIKKKDPKFFDLTIGLCKQDYKNSNKLDLIQDFLESFESIDRCGNNPYYSESITWYVEQMRVWRDLRFLVGQDLTESHLQEQILPSLVPYLKRMGGFVTRHSHRDWVKNKIAKVYRQGLELGLHLQSDNVEILELLMKLDLLEGTDLGLPFFTYVKNIRSLSKDFYAVYAEYCIQLGDTNEASFAIVKALSLEADEIQITRLKKQWQSLQNQITSVSV